ncbi:MAG: hypothetical protein ACRDDW_04865 [Candidatus Rhabdochlamydia sp.]
MNKFRNLILSGIIFLNILPLLLIKVEAEPTEFSLTVKNSFCIEDQYYICLSDNSYFVLNKILIHKGSGWFGVDKYGNPAASWLVGDPVTIERTGEYEWPFHIVNAYAKQGALAMSVNFEARNSERMNDRLRDLLIVLKEIQSDLSAIKHDLRNSKQERLLKPTPIH